MNILKLFLSTFLVMLLGVKADSVLVSGKIPVTSKVAQKQKNSGTYPGRVLKRNSDPKVNSFRHAVVFLVPQDPTSFLAPTEKARLDQIDFTFVPHILAIQAGTSVDFYNLDPVFHNIFSFSKPKKFDLGRYPKNHFKSVTFDKPGLIKLFCEIHSDMSGFILVLKTPYFTYPDSEGKFSLNVPPGDYYLRVWQEDGDALQAQIQVPDEQTYSLKDLLLQELKSKEKMFE
jgi:plastocyanin